MDSRRRIVEMSRKIDWFRDDTLKYNRASKEGNKRRKVGTPGAMFECVSVGSLVRETTAGLHGWNWSCKNPGNATRNGESQGASWKPGEIENRHVEACRFYTLRALLNRTPSFFFPPLLEFRTRNLVLRLNSKRMRGPTNRRRYFLALILRFDYCSISSLLYAPWKSIRAKYTSILRKRFIGIILFIFR